MIPYANNTYYTSLHVFSGIMFTAFEYTAFLNDASFFTEATFCAVSSLTPLIVLIFRKYQIFLLIDSKTRIVHPFALSRPYRHIVADYIFSVSAMSTFSIITYIYSQHLTIFYSSFLPPVYVLVLIANLTLFAVAVVMLRQLAVKERTTLYANSSNQLQ